MNPLESLISKAKKKPTLSEFTEFKIYLPKSSKDESGDSSFMLIDEHELSKGFNRDELYARINKQATTDNIVPTITTNILPKMKKMKKKIELKNDYDGPSSQSKRKTTKPQKGISTLPVEEWIQLNNRNVVTQLPPKQPKVNIKVASYIMNNREIFVNFINSLFKPYRKEILDDKNIITCDDIGKNTTEFSLLTHQKIVRDYLNLYSPYRGLLLYHGLGSGKTCTSIAIAEGMKSTKKVMVLLPASLERNYMEELKKCGDSLYKKQQHWEWISLKTNPEALDTLSSILNLPIEYIKRKKGAWLVNYKKENNYDTLNANEINSLDDQLDKMIESKYQFIKYNGLRREKLKNLSDNFETNIFDNTIVIIDEAHNFISRIVNKLSKEKDIVYDERGNKEKYPYALSLILYEMLLSATNCRIVLLTGTPIINYPNEIAILFNILRGFIKTWELPIETSDSHSKMKERLENILSKNRYLDYVNYTKDKILSITRNPYGFESKYSKKDGYVGVTNHSSDNEYNKGLLDDNDFEKRILSILKDNNINVNIPKIRIKLFKCLPDKLEDFTSMFISSNIENPNIGDLHNVELFKRRIIGLTSYFRSAQEGLLPRYNILSDLHVIKIPMSNYQFAIYESARKTERKEEKQVKQKKQSNQNKEDIYTEPTSTYRIFSRLFCNFVMPRPPGRPLPNEEDVANEQQFESLYKNAIKEVKKKGTNDLVEKDGNNQQEGDEVLDTMGDINYQQRIQQALEYIKENKQDILSNQGLEKYSPKYLAILENIIDPEHIGLHLIYSQFRTLEGLAIFKMVLDYHGFTQFKIKKNNTGNWVLNISDANRGKPTYALYTGTESAEEKEMIRNIYNGDWDPNLPITNQLKEIANNNNMGEIIKVLMITASGSEGINLRNTRYVHIMEPYWHPVRVEQVIGRARRICSHKNLPESLQTVEVFIYLMTFTNEQKTSDDALDLVAKDTGKTTDQPLTSDEALYEISTIKQQVTTKLTKAIKETAIDCAVYSKRGGIEQINCLQFGEPSPYTYSYTPNYKKEVTDYTNQQKKEKAVWDDLEEVEIRGDKYIYRQITPKRAKLYDIESYYQALENPNIEPRLVGYIETTDDGEVKMIDV